MASAVLRFFCFSPASLSFSLLLASSNSSGLASRSTNTKRLPSGDHAKSSTSCGVSVSFCASPPRRFSSHTCVFPSLRAERNARYLPSGLQRGCDEDTLVGGQGDSVTAGSRCHPDALFILVFLSDPRCLPYRRPTVRQD